MQTLPDKPTSPSLYAEFVGVAVATVRQMALRGQIAAQILPNGQIRVLPEAFRDALKNRTCAKPG